MIKSGLVSISFRALEAVEIISIVKQAGLNAIEWGGDVHVPHGNIAKAKEVKKLTENEGLEIAAYGSYYKVGESEQEGLMFESVLESACCLQTDTIRVWAGSKCSADSDEKHWGKAVNDAQRICELAENENVKIAFEYHANTLTDDKETAVRLLNSVKSDNIYLLWQPAHDTSLEDNLKRIDSIFPWISNVHVFHWQPGYERYLLKDGIKEWESYFAKIKKAQGDRYALLEFSKDDSIENFMKDAATLKKLLK